MSTLTKSALVKNDPMPFAGRSNFSKIHFLGTYSHLMRVENGCNATASSRHRTTVVVDPGVKQQLTLLKRFKLTLYEEGRRELRCERTFLHICRVCCEVIEDTNNLIAFSNKNFFFLRTTSVSLVSNYISNRQNYL